MKYVLSILLLFIIGTQVSAQIKFDVSKIKKVDTTEIKKTKSESITYLEMQYGTHQFYGKLDTQNIVGRIVTKVQYVYTDYPKDFDYSDLIFQRFASLYVLLPEVFNKPWIEWEIVRQTACSSTAEAKTMFHGFIVTCKEGPMPNLVVAIPPEIQVKLDAIDASVEFKDVESAKQLESFLSTKQVKVSNLKYLDKGKYVKTFQQKNTESFPIISGLMLTTGNIFGAPGPNNSPSTTSVNFFSVTPDKRLSSLVQNNGRLFDLAFVEFDIIVDADSLVFRYSFGSEEYPEYLQFNDVFGLFISGPGIKDTINLATLPDGITPVSVSAINHLNNSNYYIPNTYTNDLSLFKTWQFDGFTQVMTARVKVVPKKKYRVRFMIADYADPYYDSAIFIEAFGVRTPTN